MVVHLQATADATRASQLNESTVFTRRTSAHSDFKKMSPQDLKKSILGKEAGRL